MNARNDFEDFTEKLNPDVFEKLSEEEQDAVLEEFINISTRKNIVESDGAKNMGMGFTSDGNSVNAINMEELIDKIGRDGVKNIIRKAIEERSIQSIKVDGEKAREIIDKLNKGEKLTMEEEAIMRAVMDRMQTHNPKDIDFSAYSIIRTVNELFEKDSIDDNVHFVNSMEPFTQAAYYYAIATAISNHPINEIGKLFKKQGLEKTKLYIDSKVGSFLEMIVQYAKDNDISPVSMAVYLLRASNIIFAGVDNAFTLNNLTNNNAFLCGVFNAMCFDDYSTDITKFMKEENETDDGDTGDNPSMEDNETPNGVSLENMEENKTPNGVSLETKKKEKVDIRKLLLDD